MTRVLASPPDRLSRPRSCLRPEGARRDGRARRERPCGRHERGQRRREGQEGGSETIPLSGTLTDEQIQKAVNDGAKAFDACYTLGAGEHGKLEGTVTVQATVGPLGTVNDAKVSKSTMKNPKVDACVVDAFKTLTFPRPEGGSTVMISYPMTFGGEVVYKK